MAQTIYVGSDMRISLKGLSADGSYLNSATVTWVLLKYDGTTAGSGSLSYTASSNGNYTGTVPSTVTSTLTENLSATLQVTISQGSVDDYRELDLIAKYRRDR